MSIKLNYIKNITSFIINYKKYFVVTCLIVIVLLGIKVRTEDYNQWLTHKDIFFIDNQPVLINADGYYYLRLAEDIQQDNYNIVDERRLVGDKVKRPLPPPLLSLITAFVSDLSGLSIDKIASYSPPLLGSLVAIVVYLLARALGISIAPSLLSSLLTVLAISFVKRTSLGFFDTDSMNVMFPLLECYFLLRFAQLKTLNRYYYLIFAFISFLLFLIWWDQASIVVLATFMVPFMCALWHYKKEPTNKLIFLIVLTVFSILFLILIVVGSIDLINNFKTLFADLFSSEQSLFPKYLTAIEIKPLSLQHIIDETIANNVLFYLAILAMLYLFYTKFTDAIFMLVVITLAIFPFYFGYRFTIYSAVVISISIGLLVHYSWQFLQRKTQNNIVKSIFIILLLVFFINLSIGLYQKSTKGLTGPIAHNVFNSSLVVKNNTPNNAVIWSTWTNGYVTPYYSQRSSTIDGSNALQLEHQVYNNIPLASHSQQMAANFIKFYVVHGKQGMRQFYQLFADANSGLVFIKNVFSLSLQDAKKLVVNSIKNGTLTPIKILGSSEQILKFLFPESKRPIYLLINSETIKDGSWYQYGNWDISEQKGAGIVIFYNFYNVTEKDGKIIVNNNINFYKKKGLSIDISTEDSSRVKSKIAHLYTKFSDKFEKINYPEGNMAFEWVKPYKYGALMSLEVSKSVLNQLFIRHFYNPLYFKPIKLNTPNYQLWQVSGDVY